MKCWRVEQVLKRSFFDGLTEKEGNSRKDLKTREILITVLKSDNSIELPTTGFGIFPSLRHGDKIIPEPILYNIITSPGSAVVYRSATYRYCFDIQAQRKGISC